ncbi:MAG: pyrimidine operon attenuation protein / uracil phosphoribosyltransferase [Thauera sp.]|nr:phosphoribosyltransferase family protein [Thauera sp.]MDI3491870.1 pyrimidine operon attenuation protein / uracil phosphoribosyltransferase [Thauera sp.]
MERPPGRRTCLYDAEQLDAVVERIAVIGLLRRGAPLAERHGMAPPLRLDIKVKRYADDLALLHPETQLLEDPAHVALDLQGRSVLVVDDVLYTGHSLLRVLGYLSRWSPAEVRVAVLADRGVLRLPLRADIVGLRLDVAPTDVIECNVPPYEPSWRIELLQPERGAGNED